MTAITLVSKLIVDEQTEAILFDAMRSATKVFKGLIWNFRSQYEETGKAPISRKNLNKIMKELPRRRDSYSLSTQGTRDEVIGAYKSFLNYGKMGMKQLNRQVFARKTPSLIFGITMDMGLKLKVIIYICVLEGTEAMR